MPSYQETQVREYLNKYSPKYETLYTLAPNVSNPHVYVNVSPSQGPGKGIFSTAGRAYLDVSAIASNIATVIERKYGPGLGPSSSSPIFAVITNRINEEGLSAGKSPVGLVNPSLYAHPEAFYHVVSGWVYIPNHIVLVYIFMCCEMDKLQSK